MKNKKLNAFKALGKSAVAVSGGLGFTKYYTGKYADTVPGDGPYSDKDVVAPGDTTGGE